MIQGLYTALSGLKTNQIGLEVTSNNISNVNNPNYSAQHIVQETLPSINQHNYQVGTGVSVTSIERNEDIYNLRRINENTTEQSSLKQQMDTLSTLKTIFENSNASDGNTFSDLVENLVDTTNNIQNNPTNMSIRESAKVIGTNILDRKEQITSTLDNEIDKLNDKKSSINNKVTDLTSELDKVVKNIQQLQPLSKNVNDLMNKKEAIETQLSSLGNFQSYNSNDITKYVYSFDDKSGELDGINKSISLIKDIKNEFNHATKSLVDHIKTGLNNNFDNYKEINNWYNSSSPVKNINNIQIKMDTKAQSIASNFNTTKNVLDTIQNTYNENTKVNLDKEMINLMQYQKAYEANAKVIQTIDEMLQTTLDMKK